MKKKSRYTFFSIHTLSGTLFVVGVTYLLSLIVINIDFFNPIESALKDFTFTDIVFQSSIDEESGTEKRFANRQVSPEIVMVNLGEMPDGRPDLARLKLAAQVNRLNQYAPSVIGIDAFFRKPGEPFADSILADAFSRTKNLVLVSKLEDWDSTKNQFASLTRSTSLFSQYAKSGFANFITGGDEGYLTTRRFTAEEPVGMDKEWCFTATILSLYHPKKFEVLAARPRKTEVINFSGNLQNFFRLDDSDLEDTTVDLSFIKGKIVLIGYLGDPIGKPSLEDVFFTPMNPEMGGRSVPDMYGITVHANILSMMLSENYIAQSPGWLDPCLAIAICMLNVSIFMYIGDRYRSMSQLMMRVIQILQAIVLMFITIYSLSQRNVAVEFTISLTLLFLAADLTEIYDGSIKSTVDLYKRKIGRPRDARSKYYKRRRLFSR